MPLSSLPSGGPTIPAGAQKVSLKEIDTTTTPATEYVDVTTLEDSERMYAAPPLKEPAGGASNVTASCSASGVQKGYLPEPDPVQLDQDGNVIQPTGWVCEDTEVTYEAGKHVTWSANWNYYDS